MSDSKAKLRRITASMRRGAVAFVAAAIALAAATTATSSPTFAAGTIASSPMLVGAPYKLALSPDGRRLYVGERDSHTVQMLDTQSLQILATKTISTIDPSGFTITPDNSTLFVASTSADAIEPLDPVTLNQLPSMVSDGGPYALVLQSNNGGLYAANIHNHSVTVYTVSPRNYVATIQVGDNPAAIVADPFSSSVYTANNVSKTISIISTATNKVIGTLSTSGSPVDLALNPDGTELFVLSQGPDSMQVIDVAQRKSIATVGGLNNVRYMAAEFSADGDFAYITQQGPNPSNSLAIVNLDTGQLVSTVADIGDQPRGVVARDGIVYVALQGDQKVVKIDTNTPTAPAKPAGSTSKSAPGTSGSTTPSTATTGTPSPSATSGASAIPDPTAPADAAGPLDLRWVLVAALGTLLVILVVVLTVVLIRRNRTAGVARPILPTAPAPTLPLSQVGASAPTVQLPQAAPNPLALGTPAPGSAGERRPAGAIIALAIVGAVLLVTVVVIATLLLLGRT